MEKIYIGTKIIAAEAMDELSFLKNFKGQNVTNQETRPGYKVRYEDGYISWSPKETFERAYREITVNEKSLIFLSIPDMIRLEAVTIEPLYGSSGKSTSDLPKDLIPKE